MKTENITSAWLTPDISEPWAKSAKLQLLAVFQPLFGATLTVDLVVPEAQAARKAAAENQDLLGEVKIKCSSVSNDPLEIKLPLPFHGVFLKGGDGSGPSKFAVWSAWLGELPGFRYLRSPANSESCFWRIGLPGGGYVQARCKNLTEEQVERAFPPRLRILPPRSALPTFLHEVFEQQGLFEFPDKGARDKGRRFWAQVHDVVKKQFSLGDSLTDEDDLDYRGLITFPVWLKAKLAEALVVTVLDVSGDDASAVVKALSKGTPVNSELARRVWEDLGKASVAEVLAMRLRPPGWSRGPAPGGGKRFIPLQWIDPVNPVDLAALLTQVRRYPLAHDVLDMLPVPYRQNHPSFRGRICPVQSPESELVGLSLHLARGAKVDWDGRISPADPDKPNEQLGVGAGLVPFYEHNDGPRCMMGAKNLRQAVPVAGRQNPLVKTGGERTIQEFTKPLVDAGICPAASDSEGALALGVDLLVAYLPWKGMNVDDAIVVGQQAVGTACSRVIGVEGRVQTSVEEGMLDIQIPKRFRVRLKPGWVPTSLGRTTILPQEKDGLAVEGSTLAGGDLIAAFGLEGAEDRVKWELRYKDRSPAKLVSIRFQRPTEWMGGVLEYELVKYLKLGLGDKLMGRHGNKGVVGAILSSDQMPRLPDDEKLPPHLRGKPVDILLNPHGVMGRMNLGQVLETHIGWLLHSGVKQEQLVRSEIPAEAPLGQPFLAALDHPKVQELLETSGLDRFGRIQLVLPDGTKTLSPVVVGFQHIVRLRHISELKAQARRGGEGAIYSRSTGQAVHGRILSGGQRAGEMEVWALAGHQAEHILEELLGVKADATLARSAAKLSPSDSKSTFDGFSARLRDWFFALLIDLRTKDGKAGFAFMDPISARERIGPNKKLLNASALQEMVVASFSCQSKKSGGCPFVLLEGARITAEPPVGKSPQTSLKLDDFLEHLGFAAGAALQRKGGAYVLPLEAIRDGQPAGQLAVSFDSGKSQVKATIRAIPKQVPPGWPDSLNGIRLCGQFSAEKARNEDASAVLEEFLKEDGRWRFGQLSIACPEHATLPLKGKPPFAHTHKAIAGGLFDARLFGSVASAGTTDDSKNWGYIELPVEVPYPVKAFLGPHEDVGDFLRKHNIRRDRLPTIKVVPVLPLRYRMPLLLAESTQHDPLVEEGYVPILNACRQCEAADDDTKRAKAEARVRASVQEYFRLVLTRLNGKEGLIRHDGLGRRVDRSARLVIVPNPQLHWDEAGVPTAVLLELLGDELMQWAAEKRDRGDLAEMISAMIANRDDAGLLAEWSWRTSIKDQALLGEGHKLLCRFLEARSDILVVLNRQPSLHRDSIQAFRPVPLPPEAGEVLQLCPLVCKGFSADFDGDEMAIHLPLSLEAREEAKRMLPTQNMFSLGTGKLLASYEQDFVMGMYWLSREESGLKHRLLSTLPGDCCRQWVGRTVLNQDTGTDLLEHLASAHRTEASELIWKLSNLAYDCCSRIGISFGFYELMELSINLRDESREALKSFDASNPDQVNVRLNAIAQKPLVELLQGGESLFHRPGLHFAAMALSGARGKQQVRQLIAARGFLSPGATGFDCSSDDFLVGSSLVCGMSPEEAFRGAMNARSSMCDKKLGTRQAGYLTRRLVTALWPLRVVAEDCGDAAELRTPVTCRSRDGICAACYGALPDGNLPPIGFPAGLIAAQSIGERGTQLSMQSFHTGEKAFTIKTVIDILDGDDGKELFENVGRSGDFVSAIRKAKAYKELDERHFQVLWRAIHLSSTKTLKSATQSVGLITRIGFEQQAKNILVGVCSGQISSIAEPFARVLFNRFGTRRRSMKEDAT